MTRTTAIRLNPARVVASARHRRRGAVRPGRRRQRGGPCRGQTATIEGTSGPDKIYGTAGKDVIRPEAGHDLVWGYGGNDVICGGAGDDRVRGGSGTDTLDGGTEADDCENLGEDTRYNCQTGTQTTFMPTRHGFPFTNFFTAIPASTTPFGPIGLDYGLCGGMAFAALDNWRVDDVAPGTATTPQSGQTFDYLWSRLLDSLTIDFASNLYRFNDLQWKTNTALTTSNNTEVALIKGALTTPPGPGRGDHPRRRPADLGQPPGPRHRLVQQQQRHAGPEALRPQRPGHDLVPGRRGEDAQRLADPRPVHGEVQRAHRALELATPHVRRLSARSFERAERR